MNIELLYIDPGSGSFLTQAIIAAVLAVPVFFKTVRYRIVSLFSKKKHVEKEDNKG